MIAKIRFETNQSEQEIKIPEKTNFRKNVELDDNGLIIGLRAIQLLIGSDFLVLQHEGLKYNTYPASVFSGNFGPVAFFVSSQWDDSRLTSIFMDQAAALRRVSSSRS